MGTHGLRTMRPPRDDFLRAACKTCLGGHEEGGHSALYDTIQSQLV